MIYVVGVIGFISGFALGQFILMGLLKDKTNDEILSSRKLKFIYGTLNWFVALVVCITAIRLYQLYIFS